jgi:hypothetical protein
MTKQVTMSLELATKLYNGSSDELKELILENFPQLGNIMERVKTFEDACKVIGEDPSSDFFTNCSLRPHEIATRKVETIAKALNQEWFPNWNDSSELKYYPWFDLSSSGSGFSYYDYVFVNSGSYVGSRLVFKTRELAIYAGKQFTEIYKEMFTL